MPDRALMPADFDARDLRTAFGRFATGVTVVTFRLADGRRVGITANSFTSVSLSPPLISFNYRTASPYLAAVCACSHFAVHVLAANQLDLSQRMSRPAEDKFLGLSPQEGMGGAPRFPDSLATFECELWKTVEAGDHHIILGRVVKYEHADGEPLMYINGRYAPACTPLLA